MLASYFSVDKCLDQMDSSQDAKNHGTRHSRGMGGVKVVVGITSIERYLAIRTGNGRDATIGPEAWRAGWSRHLLLVGLHPVKKSQNTQKQEPRDGCQSERCLRRQKKCLFISF